MNKNFSSWKFQYAEPSFKSKVAKIAFNDMKKILGSENIRKNCKIIYDDIDSLFYFLFILTAPV